MASARTARDAERAAARASTKVKILTPEVLERCRRRHAEGVTIAAMAAALGVSKGQLSLRMRDMEKDGDL